VTSHSVAIVVLGARIQPDGRLSGALARRIQRGARAWHERVAQFVVCSGGRSWNGRVEAQAMRDALVEMGVESGQILLETRSQCTADNARETADLLRSKGIHHAVIVTNHWHMRRALADFRLCGIQATPLASDSAPMTPGQRAIRHLVERTCQLIDRARLNRGASS